MPDTRSDPYQVETALARLFHRNSILRPRGSAPRGESAQRSGVSEFGRKPLPHARWRDPAGGAAHRRRLERFQAKWRPVRVKKTRQITNLEPRFDSIETEKALELAAIGDFALRRAFGFGRFECRSNLFGAGEGPADISIFRTDIKRNQPIAVLAVVWNPLRSFCARSLNTCEHLVHLIFTFSSTMNAPG
jgi:hypothetical protein